MSIGEPRAVFWLKRLAIAVDSLSNSRPSFPQSLRPPIGRKSSGRRLDVWRPLANHAIVDASATQDKAKPLRPEPKVGWLRLITTHETCFYQLPSARSLIRDGCYRRATAPLSGL